MEKLLNLLNDYRTEKGERNLNEFEVSQTLDSLNYLRLFIEWLCNSGRIDISKTLKHYYWTSLAEELVMRLSISDTPIEDLISYLKD